MVMQERSVVPHHRPTPAYYQPPRKNQEAETRGKGLGLLVELTTNVAKSRHDLSLGRAVGLVVGIMAVALINASHG